MEANADSALELLARAHAAFDKGNDEEAARLTAKSLRLCECFLNACLDCWPASLDWVSCLNAVESPEGLKLKEHLDRFGPGSAAAKAVARIRVATGHYSVLNVKPGASVQQIRRAYKMLSLEVHPDRNHARGAEDAFKRVNEAFIVLSDSSQRAAFDNREAEASRRQRQDEQQRQRRQQQWQQQQQ